MTLTNYPAENVGRDSDSNHHLNGISKAVALVTNTHVQRVTSLSHQKALCTATDVKKVRMCRPNKKKISVFRVTGLKILGRVGTHINFFIFFFCIILCILKGISPFKMHKIIFYPQNLKKFLGFTSKFR